MRTDGPEFQRGWQARFEVDGVTAVVEARHFDRNRLPTGHEIAKQAMRGRGYAMVQTPVYEWYAHLRDGHAGRCTIRPTPSGQFEIAGTRRLHRSVEEAVRAWAAPQVARAMEARALREPPVEEASGPRP